MGDTSRSTSISPSSRNHLKDFVWISTRLGSSSEVPRVREKLILVFLPSFCSFTLTIKLITPINVVDAANRPHHRWSFFVNFLRIICKIFAQQQIIPQKHPCFEGIIRIIVQFTILPHFTQFVKRCI